MMNRMADERINMTANEFFDSWTQWCSMPVTVEQANLLSQVFTNIMTTFEERGSPAQNRAIIDGVTGSYIWQSERVAA